MQAAHLLRVAGSTPNGAGVAGATLMLAAFDGTGYREMLSTANVASGASTLRLAGYGGPTTVGGTLSVTGAATFSGLANHPDGSTAAPSIAFTADPDTGFARAATNILEAVAGGVRVATFRSTFLDIPLSTASTGVGTGALQVAGGIYAGAASVFGSTVTTLSSSILGGSGGNARLASVVGRVDLDPINGRVALYGATAVDRYLDILRADGTTVGVQLLSNGTSTFLGGATFGGAVTSSGKILSANTGLFSTDATLSNYSATNGVYLNGNAGGWLRLKGDGTGASNIQINGGSTGNITVDAGSATRLTINGTTGAATFAGAVTASTSGNTALSVFSTDAATGNPFVRVGYNSNLSGQLSNDAATGKTYLDSRYNDVTSAVIIRTKASGTPVVNATFDSTGAATFAGAVTAGAITSTGASAALNVNGTSGAVIATVSSGSSIAGSGQGILSLNISDQLWSIRNAAGPFSIRDDTSGNYYLNITRATGAVRFHAYGAGTATFDSSGNITSVSDARLKNITGTFTKGLAEIVKLTPKLYTWKPDTGLVTDDINATLIAQDLIAAGIPEAVTTYRTVAVMEDDVQSAEDIAAGKPVTQHVKLDADGKPVTQRVDANYSVSDRTVIAALVNAVKELKAEIDALKAAK